MASTKAPLFGLDASGSLAKSIVFSKWKGRTYVRRHSTPSNPQSALQTGMRASFKFISQNWAALSAGGKAEWQAIADLTAVTGLNAQMAYNQERVRRNLGIHKQPSIVTPNTPGAPTSPVATAGPKSVVLTWVAGTGTNANYTTWIHRSLTGTFTPSIDNAIAVLDFAVLTYTDIGLETGISYFYEIRHNQTVGTFGAGSAEVTAIPT